jgi:hypothetical protein
VRRASSSALRDYVARLVRAMTTARAAATTAPPRVLLSRAADFRLVIVVHGASGS